MLRIRQARLSKNMTLEDVGRLVGLTKAAVQMIETGQNKPSYDVMCRLETLFGMPHNELLGEINVINEKEEKQ